jgi:Zn finger protein HypA/HybF involved in hydrogenase expression
MTETEVASIPVRPIHFFCKQCQAVVDVTRIPNKYLYKCKTCNGEHVAFGSAKSIENFFHVKGN